MKKTLIPILLSAFISTAAEAETKNLSDALMDSIKKSEKIIYFGKGEEPDQESSSKIIQKFYEDQFRHSQDPLAPYFLFMSKDNSLAMGMGGCVRMRAYYDWGGAIPSPGFAPYLIPMQNNPLRERYFGTTPSGTALFFRVIGANKKLGEYQLYIQADFSGYQSRDFKLKKAYAIINDWTIGYANSTFSDPSALPPIIDASGPNSKMSATDVLVRWMHDFKNKHWTLAASVETPSDKVQEIDGETAKVEQYVPNFAMFGQFAWGQSDHIRLAAIYRSLSYRDLITQKNHYKPGWGVQLSGVWHPIYSVTLYGAANTGYGYGSLGGDWLMGNYDLVSDPAKKGTLYTPFCIGGYFAAQYNFTHNVYASATFGGTRYNPYKGADPSEYKGGLYITANVFWNLTARISCAAEFNLGRRQNQDGETKWARRIGAMAQFSF